MSGLFKFFRSIKSKEQDEEIFGMIEVATSVLLIEMARADFHQDDFEDNNILLLYMNGLSYDLIVLVKIFSNTFFY